MLFFSKQLPDVPIKWFPTHPGETISPRAGSPTGTEPRTIPAKPRITTSNVSDGTAKVLIADPEQQGRAHAVRVLSDHRVRFSVAPDANMVLRLLEKNDYALCIIDAEILARAAQMIPALAKTLVKRRAVVVVTSRAGSAADKRLAHSIHAQDFLVKPIARDQIHLIVERVVGVR